MAEQKFNMIRFLDGLVLLKEVDGISGISKTASQLRKNNSDSIVIIRHTPYIYRDVLCDVAKEKSTSLDDYIQMGELADKMSIQKLNLSKRIKMMKANPEIKLFEFLQIGDIYFVKIDKEMRYLLQHYQPFYATLRDMNMPNIKVYPLGDIPIGFY